MALSNRFSNPFPNFFTLSLDFLAGGTLNFYVSATGARATTWPDAARTGGGNPNPITLDSYGKPPVDIFLDPSVTYRVQLLDAAGASIWTADPYYDPLLQQQAKFQVYAGNPNGFVAGNAGTPGGSPSDVVYDSTDNLVYVCTTTGIAAAAVWTSIAVSATSALPPPQGRLTLTTGVAVLAADVIAATAVLYTPYNGNLLPIYSGSAFALYTFAELTLTLAAQHTLNSLFDVYAFLNSGVVTLATSPAWTTPGNFISAGTLTTGTAARGAGAPALARVNGLWTNATLMTGRNGAATYSIGANQGTYLGTIWTDATAGQITQHISYGQNRRPGPWNAYNRVTNILQAGDPGSAWAAYNTATIRAANGTAANGLTVLCGLAEEVVVAAYSSQVLVGGSNRIPVIGVGYNSTTAISGRKSQIGVAAAFLEDQHASFEAAPFFGLGAFISLQAGDGSASTTWTNGSGFDELRAVWRG